MPSVAAFLEANKDLERSESTTSVLDTVVVSSTVTGVTPTRLEFFHLGATFSIDRADVVDVTEITEPPSPVFPSGKAVTLVLKASAKVQATSTLAAADLVSTLPFALSRPAAPPIPALQSPAEMAWRAGGA